MHSIITLQHQRQLLQIVPSMGASIAKYAIWHEGDYVDFLRPASSQAIDTEDISGMSSFLMAPWAGRIQNGRFNYEGRTIHYPSCLLDNPHSMHGFTRDLPWEIKEQTPNSLSLKFIHHANAQWPFSFEIEQQYLLNNDGLHIFLIVENTGHEKMPFSMGYHPFFPCDEHTKLYADVQQVWHTDEELMPTHLGSHFMVSQLAGGYPVQEEAWDIIFTGWDKKVRIEWQDRVLIYQVSAPMDFLVLYNPQGESWFCAEPFANITDSFNLRDKFARKDIGGVDIAPHEFLRARFDLQATFK